jgi:hypothetical protein
LPLLVLSAVSESRYVGSILQNYLLEKRRDQDWGTLHRLCGEYQTANREKFPNAGAELFVHLRAGDTNRYNVGLMKRCVDQHVERLGHPPKKLIVVTVQHYPGTGFAKDNDSKSHRHDELASNKKINKANEKLAE